MIRAVGLNGGASLVVGKEEQHLVRLRLVATRGANSSGKGESMTSVRLDRTSGTDTQQPLPLLLYHPRQACRAKQPYPTSPSFFFSAASRAGWDSQNTSFRILEPVDLSTSTTSTPSPSYRRRECFRRAFSSAGERSKERDLIFLRCVSSFLILRLT